MITKLDVPVSVSLYFDYKKGLVMPRWVLWEGRLYPIVKVGLHHTYREGRTLLHVFSVVSRSVFFKLKLDSETLHWRLLEVNDGV